MDQAVHTEEVLGAIFKFLPFKHLKEVRLVNKIWNNAAGAEIRKRAAEIQIDHDLYNIKKFYQLELLCKNKDIVAKVPMSIHVRAGGTLLKNKVDEKFTWRVLKDIATFEPWKTRVTRLMLSDFWAADLNRILPFVLSKLPNLRTLVLSCVNNTHRVGKSVIPKDFVIPAASQTAKYPVTKLTVFWCGAGGRNESSILDPRIFAQCPCLTDFSIQVGNAAYEVMQFFKRIQKMDKGYFSSLDCVRLRVKLEKEKEELENPSLMAALALFINRVRPTALDFSNCELFEPVVFFKYIKTEIRSLTVDVMGTQQAYYCTTWMLQNIQKYSVFTNLQQLHLHPNPRDLRDPDQEPPLPDSLEFAHNLAHVTTLQLSFDLKSDVSDELFQKVLEDAAVILPNVERVEFYELYMDKCMGVMERVKQLKCIFLGLMDFPKLRKVSFNLVDFSGDLVERGEKVMHGDQEGLFEGLSALQDEEAPLKEFSISARLDYDISIDSLLVVFFSGYDPSIKLNLDVIQKSDGHTKLQLSGEEFAHALHNAHPDFSVPIPGHDGLFSGMPRYLKMINYRPMVNWRR